MSGMLFLGHSVETNAAIIICHVSKLTTTAKDNNKHHKMQSQFLANAAMLIVTLTNITHVTK